jgi:preprotein translocase subunit SecD
LPAVQVTANRGSAPIDQSIQQKVTAALTAQHIAATNVSVQGDTCWRHLHQWDTQKSAADAIKAALGDGYTVAFKLQSTVPGLVARDRRAFDAAGPGSAGRRALPDAGRSERCGRQAGNSYADDIRACCARRTSVTSRSRAIPCRPGHCVILRSADDRSKASDAIANDSPISMCQRPSTGDRFVLNVVVKPDKLRRAVARCTITQNLDHACATASMRWACPSR